MIWYDTIRHDTIQFTPRASGGLPRLRPHVPARLQAGRRERGDEQTTVTRRSTDV